MQLVKRVCRAVTATPYSVQVNWPCCLACRIEALPDADRVRRPHYAAFMVPSQVRLAGTCVSRVAYVLRIARNMKLQRASLCRNL